jgi:hypothetical protein
MPKILLARNKFSYECCSYFLMVPASNSYGNKLQKFINFFGRKNCSGLIRDDESAGYEEQAHDSDRYVLLLKMNILFTVLRKLCFGSLLILYTVPPTLKNINTNR